MQTQLGECCQGWDYMNIREGLFSWTTTFPANKHQLKPKKYIWVRFSWEDGKKGTQSQVGSNTKENSLTARPHAKHKISAEEFEVSGALWVTVAITNFKHSPSLTRLTKPFPEGLAKEKVYSPKNKIYYPSIKRSIHMYSFNKIMQYMTWQKKSEVKNNL